MPMNNKLYIYFYIKINLQNKNQQVLDILPICDDHSASLLGNLGGP